jgi:hypothetical protein
MNLVIYPIFCLLESVRCGLVGLDIVREGADTWAGGGGEEEEELCDQKHASV